MQNFSQYFQLGWQYILNWHEYNHILLVIVLCGIYSISEWKTILILITAFTIGHGITQLLCLFNYIHINPPLINFLIPLTILMTSASNILNKRPKRNGGQPRYIFALFFGLVHGMGLPAYLKDMQGKDSPIAIKLLAFNTGLEFGQLIVIAGVLILSFAMIWILKIKKWDWIFFLSSAIFGISFIMAAERLFSLL